MDYPKFMVSNQKEESISIQRVKMGSITFVVIAYEFKACFINYYWTHEY